jgi:integrase
VSSFIWPDLDSNGSLRVQNGAIESRSLQLIFGTLKSAYKFAVESELLARNPIASVRRPTLQNKPMNAWSEEQARQFLADTRDDELAVAWALLLTRGLRRGELCGLRWEAIDLESGTASIVRTLVVVDGKVQESTQRHRPADVPCLSIPRSYRS